MEKTNKSLACVQEGHVVWIDRRYPHSGLISKICEFLLVHCLYTHAYILKAETHLSIFFLARARQARRVAGSHAGMPCNSILSFHYLHTKTKILRVESFDSVIMAKNTCISTSEIQQAILASLNLFPNLNELKPEQMLVIENIVKGKDVFAVLPTGFAKSLSFQILPTVVKTLKKSGLPPSPVCVVVCHLKSIIKDQVSYLRSLGLKAAFVGESDECDKRIINGNIRVDLLYGSLESFVGDDKYQGMFSLVVCDEVHTTVQW